MTDSESQLATCGLCGKPAQGHAQIGDQRYCHGDDDPDPTCYMRASWSEPKLPSKDSAEYLSAKGEHDA